MGIWLGEMRGIYQTLCNSKGVNGVPGWEAEPSFPPTPKLRNFPQAGELMSCRCDLEVPPPLPSGSWKGQGVGKAGRPEKPFLVSSLSQLICTPAESHQGGAVICSRSPAPWRPSQGHGASLPNPNPNPAKPRVLMRRSGLAVNWEGLRLGSPLRLGLSLQPPVGTGLLPGIFPPGPG